MIATNLVIDLDASTLTQTQGQTIPSVTNQAATAATASAASSLPTMDISGATKRVKNSGSQGLALSLPSMGVGELTVFMVLRRDDYGSAANNILTMSSTKAGLMDTSGEVSASGTNRTPFPSGMASSTQDMLIVLCGSRTGFTGLGDGVKLFRNGQMSFRTQDSNSARWPNDTGITAGFLGGIGAGIGTGFVGSWRRFALYDRALTEAEIATNSAEIAAACGLTLVTPTTNLIFDGDSQTVGYIGNSTDRAYTDMVALRSPAPLKVHNFGIVGQTAVQMQADFATQVVPLYDATKQKNVCVLWAGTNDLFASQTDATITAAFNALKSAGVAARGAGFTVIVIPALPRGSTAALETARQDFNARIANDASFYHKLVDVTLLPKLFNAGAQNDAPYFQSDKGHLTSFGYQVLGNEITRYVYDYNPPLTLPGVATAVRADLDTNSTKLAYLTGDTYARLGANGAGLTALASQTSVDTVDDFLDTEIAAIKTKTDTLPASPAAVGSAMTLTVSERTAVANEVEAHLINEADGQTIVNAIVGAIGNTNLSEAAVVAAVRADLERGGGNLALLLARAAPDNASIANIQTQTDRLRTMIEADGLDWRFDANALEMAPDSGVPIVAIEQVASIYNQLQAVAGSSPALIIPAAPPGQTTGYLVTRDARGNAVGGVTLEFKLIRKGDGLGVGNAFQGIFSATSNAVETDEVPLGLLTTPLLQSATYKVLYGGRDRDFATGSADSVPIPDIVQGLI